MWPNAADDVIRIRQILNINNKYQFSIYLHIHNVVCCVFRFLGMSVDRMVVVKWISQEMQLAIIVIYFHFYILLVESVHNKYSEITIIACDAELTSKNHKMSYLLKSLFGWSIFCVFALINSILQESLATICFDFLRNANIAHLPSSQLNSLLNFSLHSLATLRILYVNHMH